MKTETTTLFSVADAMIACARRVTTGANVHDINGSIGKIVNAKTLLEYYDEYNMIEKYNIYAEKMKNYILDLQKLIEKCIQEIR